MTCIFSRFVMSPMKIVRFLRLMGKYCVSSDL